MAPSGYNAAQFAGLLRRERDICAPCASAKLALPLRDVLEAAAELARTLAVDEGTRACSVCGHTARVLSLTKEVQP